MQLYNLREVHKPADIEEAIRLLRRRGTHTVALAGGVTVVGEGTPDIEAVVDLSSLGLETVERAGEVLRLGAMTRLQTLVEDLSDVADGLLAEAARRTVTWHIRNRATIGGAMMCADGPAPLLTAMSVLDIEVTLRAPGEQTMSLEAFLTERGRLKKEHALLLGVTIREPRSSTGHSYVQVGRTPADTPILCVACRASDGEMVRLAVGGVWQSVVACQMPGDAAQAAQVLAERAGDTPLIDDYLGSADYRTAVFPILVGRAIAQAYTLLG